MTQLTRTPLAEQAAALLLTRIREGEWPLGSRLPGETTLAPQLGVGRSTVREAIRQLAGRGVLESRQGSGVYVTALDVHDEWDAVVRRADIVSVLEARMAVEVHAAELAAIRRTPTELRAMRRALDERASARDVEALVDADIAFHRAVVAAAHNAILLELFDGFTPRVRRAMVDMLRMRPLPAEADHDAHLELADTVAARDAGLAARLSRSHLRSLVERLS